MRVIPPFTSIQGPPSTPVPPVLNSAIKITNMDFTAENGVLFNHIPEIEVTTGDFTISFWLQIVDLGGLTPVIMQKINDDGDNTDPWFFFMFGDDTVSLGSELEVTVAGVGALDDDEDLSGIDFSDWHNVVLQKSATSISTWVDGAQIGAGAPNVLALVSDPTSFLSLFYQSGVGPGSFPCDIRLADFRFYDSELSPSDLQDLADKMDVTTSLVARIKFENNCLDSVDSMDGVAGAGVQYTLGPPGLPP